MAGSIPRGDIFIFEEDGYLRIVDRIKDMIIRGGENIYQEIETSRRPLATMAVLEAAVVGQADDVLGEVRRRIPSRSGRRRRHVEELRRCAPSGSPSTSARWRSSSSTSSPRIVGKIDKPALRKL